MTDETGVIVCPGVVPVLVGPLQVLIPIFWGLLLGMLGGIVALFKPSSLKNLAKLLWRQKLAVCLLAIAAGGLFYGFRTMVWANRQATSGAEAGKDWTMARGNLHRTGVVPGTPSPNVKKLIWSYKDGSSQFYSSPAVVGNRVYVASVARGVRDFGKIFCFDADTGDIVWTGGPDDYRPTFSSPVVSGDYLVCGEGLHETRDARVICLDVRPEAKGKVVWTFATNNHAECTPVIADGRVYFGAGDDGIYCLDLKPDADGKAKLHWHVPNSFYFGPDGKQLKDGLKDARFVVGATVLYKSEIKDGNEVPIMLRPLATGEDVNAANSGMKSGRIKTVDLAGRTLTIVTPQGEDRLLTMSEYSDAETSLAVHDGLVYVGLGNEGMALCIFEAKTGKFINRLKMPYPVFSPPTIADGKLYLGMGDGDYVKAGSKGQVCCLNLKTLKTEWEHELTRTVLGAVAVKDDRLYFGCDDGVVYCLSRKGNPIGSFPTRSPIKAAPAVTERAVYVASDGGLLFALDRKTLEPLWEFRMGLRTPSPNPEFISSPVVARGHVYVGTSNDGFQCIGEVGDEKPRTPLWANPLGGPGRAGNDDDSPFPEYVARDWAYPRMAADANHGKTRAAASVACWGDDVYVPITEGKKTRLVCLPRKSETDTPKARWVYPTLGEVVQAPVIMEDRILLCVAGQSKDFLTSRQNLCCLDRASGSLLWEKPVLAHAPLTVTDRQILVQEKPNFLTCVDRDGKMLWSSEVGLLRHPPAASASMVLVATSQPTVANPDVASIAHPQHAVLALDRDTGIILWRCPLASAPVAAPVLAKSIFYLGTEAGLEARSLVNGAPIPDWACAGGIPSADIALNQKDVCFVNTAGDLIVANGDKGTVKIRLAGALPGFPPLPSRGQVMVVTETGLALLDIEAKEPQLEPWLEKSVYGDLSAPAVMSDSRVFLPTRGLGLVCIGRKK